MTNKIIFFGDSITSAEWIHPNWREIVEYILKEEYYDDDSALNDTYGWSLRCINSGFNAATTQHLLTKVESDVLSYKPDTVIVMATSNDVFANITPAQHKQNIQVILDIISEKVPHVIYCTDICSSNPNYDEKYKPFLDAAMSIFPYKNILAINMFEELLKFDLSKMFTLKSIGNTVAGIKPGEPDFIHPNILGNAYIAKIILKRVFDVEFNPEKYLYDLKNEIMFPEY